MYLLEKCIKKSGNLKNKVGKKTLGSYSIGTCMWVGWLLLTT